MKKRFFALLLTVMIVATATTACKKSQDNNTYNLIQDTKHGAVFLNVSIDDFIDSGFSLGDSCDVTFSNGFKLEDVPFYSGYYVRPGDAVIVAYPGEKYVSVTRNYLGLWKESGLTEKDTATLKVRKAGKYKVYEEALSLTYSNSRDDYSDDIQFANFRELKGGNLKAGYLFRGASPVDNQKGRASYVDSLLKKNGIRFILNLADSDKELLEYKEKSDFSSTYADGLYKSDSMVLLDLSANFTSENFKKKLAIGLQKMMKHEGPIYINCLEGKDRTGFVCFLLESLAGAKYEEMLADYMKSYENYYGITKVNNSDKYDAIVYINFNGFASYLHNTDDSSALVSADYSQDAIKYLLDAGMTSDEVEALRRMITK